MDEPELLKKRKKKGFIGKADDKDSENTEHGLFEELDLDLDSDHPVHEKFVDEKGLREIRDNRLKKQKLRKI